MNRTLNADKAPASLSTFTLKPALIKEVTPCGVSATRRSLSYVSLGTPVDKWSRELTLLTLLLQSLDEQTREGAEMTAERILMSLIVCGCSSRRNNGTSVGDHSSYQPSAVSMGRARMQSAVWRDL